MKKIELFEKAIAEQAASLKEWGINPTLFWAYRNSITAGNDRIDFGEAIWDSEVGEITETLKENGITEFTISSTFSSLIPTLAEFAKHGFQMAGLTEVKANYTDFQTQERAVIPAIRMAAEEAQGAGAACRAGNPAGRKPRKNGKAKNTSAGQCGAKEEFYGRDEVVQSMAGGSGDGRGCGKRPL